jgi:mycothiol conjugate amidase Mca
LLEKEMSLPKPYLPADIPLTLMAIRAHPDDECFVVGGTLAHYSRLGIRTVLVTCTAGENGEIVDPTMDAEAIRPILGEIRKRELEESCRILGISNLELLGYRDSGMAGTPENDDPRAFNRADLEEATSRLVALVRRYRPQVLITDNEVGGYGHPDHIMANRITHRAFEVAGDPNYRADLGEPYQPLKLYYTEFSNRQVRALWRAMKEQGLEMPWRDENADPDTEPTWGAPDEKITAIIDVRAEVPLKLASLRAHRTQIKPDFWMLTLPQELQIQFLGYETFERAHSLVPAPEHEDDLFAGVTAIADTALRSA